MTTPQVPEDQRPPDQTEGAGASRQLDHLTKPRLVLRRLAQDRTLLLSVFISIIAATTLSAGAPVYLASLEQLAFNISLDRTSSRFMNIHVLAPGTLLSKRSLAEADARLVDAIETNIAPIYRGQERYFRGGLQLVGHSGQPLPNEGVPGLEVTRGYLQSLSNLGPHARVLEGAMATSVVESGPLGPELEAVVGKKTFDQFEFEIGMVLTLTPVLESSKRMSVRIAGVIEPADPESDYWRFAGVYLEPALLQTNIPVGLEFLGDTFEDTPDVRTVPLFVTDDAMIAAIAQAFPGALVKPNWFLLLDRDRLKEWSVSESGRRLRGFEDSLVESMPGSSITTRSVRGLIDELERRSLLALMPMLVLIVVALTTILFYMAMMVSYVVRSRERDAALLRTRGANIFEVLRLYALEGVAMTGVAVVTAPFLAMAIVALSGKLPYFQELTGGEFLPVRWGALPFLVAGGAGLLCLLILVVPGTAGARMGLLVHKMRSSRPPTVPFFHRYYLDIALLTFGGLIFWELNARGNLVTGGLFTDVQINETLLFAPVLFLIVVALLFLRFFPILVRFVSGESPALAHLLAAATVLVLAPGIAYVAITGEGGGAPAGSVALLLALGAVYWATNRASHVAMRAVGLAAQAVLVGGVIALEPLGRDQALYPVLAALVAIVPVQIAFILLRGTMKIVPVWLSMALLHMARNPLQYAWLILLLVLATGLGILATTVGGTLEASQIDRARYEAATDLRVAGFTSHRAGSLVGLLESYGSTPGVASVSLGYRDDGTIGPTPFEVLGLDPEAFSEISWYRDDFSGLPLSEVMAQLDSGERLERVPLPPETVEIGAWIKPLVFHPEMQLWALIDDQTGDLTGIKLGEPRSGEWQLMRGEVPSHLVPPLYLIAMHVTEPAFFLGLESPGAFLVDDVHVTTSTTTDETIVLEDFEGDTRWAPIITEELSSDLFAVTDEDVFNGDRVGTFVFGSETNQGYRGIYRSPTRGPASVVVSSELLSALGGKIGDSYVAAISGRRLPVVIRGVVDYFPTLSPKSGRFLLIDRESLLRHLNVLSSAVDSEPNELFVAGSSSDHQSLRAAVDELVGRDGVVVDGVEMLETIRLDPLVTAGWRPIVLVAPVIVVLVVAFGYIAYLLLFAAHSESEMGILRTFGLSRLQLVGLAGFEHLAIVSVGLGLGTWAGFQASKLIVDPLLITESGERVVPPYILLTSWDLMGPTYAALGVVLVGMLFVLVRTLSRVDLTHITRVEAN